MISPGEITISAARDTMLNNPIVANGIKIKMGSNFSA
jgi:hypothetical protein